MDATDKEGWTPLHVAASTAHTDCVKFVIRLVMWSPPVISYLAHHRLPSTVLTVSRLLLDHGANICALNVDNCTPMDLAGSSEHAEPAAKEKVTDEEKVLVSIVPLKKLIYGDLNLIIHRSNDC